MNPSKIGRKRRADCLSRPRLFLREGKFGIKPETGKGEFAGGRFRGLTYLATSKKKKSLRKTPAGVTKEEKSWSRFDGRNFSGLFRTSKTIQTTISAPQKCANFDDPKSNVIKP